MLKSGNNVGNDVNEEGCNCHCKAIIVNLGLGDKTCNTLVAFTSYGAGKTSCCLVKVTCTAKNCTKVDEHKNNVDYVRGIDVLHTVYFCSNYQCEITCKLAGGEGVENTALNNVKEENNESEDTYNCCTLNYVKVNKLLLGVFTKSGAYKVYKNGNQANNGDVVKTATLMHIGNYALEEHNCQRQGKKSGKGRTCCRTCFFGGLNIFECSYKNDDKTNKENNGKNNCANQNADKSKDRNKNIKNEREDVALALKINSLSNSHNDAGSGNDILFAFLSLKIFLNLFDLILVNLRT